MGDIQLAYQNSVDSITDIKNFINNSFSGVSGSPIVDPLSDAGKTRGTGTGIAAFEDETITTNFPKITIILGPDFDRERITAGKSEFRERHRTIFGIQYTCNKQHTWTYNGTEYKGKQQCVRYLQYLGDQLKKYSGSFDRINELVPGSISPPQPDSDTNTYTAFMSLKVDSYGRIGE